MKVLRPVLSLVFACLVLVSSTNFVVGFHYCGGQVKHVGLFDKAEACEMEKQLPPCHRELGSACCEDLTLIHEDEDFNSNCVSVEWSPSLIFDDVATTILLAEVVHSASPVGFQIYHPPVLSVDRPVAHRSFQI